MGLQAAAASDVQRVMFLALRGEDGQVECLRPVPLSNPQQQTLMPTQLMLLGEDAEALSSALPRRGA